MYLYDFFIDILTFKPARYLELMTVLNSSGDDVFPCVTQLFDFYCYTTLMFFPGDVGLALSDASISF